jgi:hypothetical protein
MYVSASQTGITFILLAYCNSRVLSICESVLDQTLKAFVEWAHEQDSVIPDIQDAVLKKAIGNRLKFWSLVNCYVLENGPFYPPVKLFRHCVQLLYSKTKGGVDGSAQARAILRCSTSAMKWEQTIVTQMQKTLAVNAFIACRIKQKKGMLDNKSTLSVSSTFENV